MKIARSTPADLSDLEDMVCKTAHMTELARLVLEEVTYVLPGLPPRILTKAERELLAFVVLEAASFADTTRESFYQLGGETSQ